MFLFYTLAHLAAITTAKVVQELDVDTFNSFVTDNELSLIAFDAPWCIFSQELKPEYESAGSRLQGEGWPLAHVDCDKEEYLCSKYDAIIYPTILVFHGKEYSVYNGDRKADAIVSFMKRHSQPVVTELSSPHNVIEFSSMDRVTIVGYFDKHDETSKTIFTSVAEAYRDDYLFGSISNDTFSQLEIVKKPSIVLYKSFDEGRSFYTKSFDEDMIDDFIWEAASPLIREVGVDIRPRELDLVGGLPVAFIFAEETKERTRLAEELRPVAQATKGRIVWVTADPNEYANIASRVALQPGKWPAFAIEDGINDLKFAFSRRGSAKDLSKKAIRAMVNDFLHGKLEATVKSDPIPATQDGPVLDVVAYSFPEIVINNSRDILVLYYSPTCKHCKAIAPIYDRLGSLLSPYTDQVVIAKIDATSNDVSPRVDSYPTLKLFKSGSKETPTTFKGNRTVEDFVKFIRKNGSTKVAKTLENVFGDVASDFSREEL